MGTLNHVNQLFTDGKSQKVVKSHCCICHKKLDIINKEVRGNACGTCNNRADKVARDVISEKDSDFLLKYQLRDLEEETWWIDGVEYIKSPNGELYERT